MSIELATMKTSLILSHTLKRYRKPLNFTKKTAPVQSDSHGNFVQPKFFSQLATFSSHKDTQKKTGTPNFSKCPFHLDKLINHNILYHLAKYKTVLICIYYFQLKINNIRLRSKKVLFSNSIFKVIAVNYM